MASSFDCGERSEAIDVVLGRITLNYPRRMTILIPNDRGHKLETNIIVFCQELCYPVA